MCTTRITRTRCAICKGIALVAPAPQDGSSFGLEKTEVVPCDWALRNRAGCFSGCGQHETEIWITPEEAGHRCEECAALLLSSHEQGRQSKRKREGDGDGGEKGGKRQEVGATGTVTH